MNIDAPTTGIRQQTSQTITDASAMVNQQQPSIALSAVPSQVAEKQNAPQIPSNRVSITLSEIVDGDTIKV